VSAYFVAEESTDQEIRRGLGLTATRITTPSGGAVDCRQMSKVCRSGVIRASTFSPTMSMGRATGPWEPYDGANHGLLDHYARAGYEQPTWFIRYFDFL
jgi:hypothetical protein